MGARCRGSRASLFVAVAALALAVAAVVVIACQTDPREVRAMRAPGAIVGVTYGSQPLVLGTWGQKCLLRAFPALQPRIGGAVLHPNGAPPASLVIWKNLGSISAYDGPPPMLRLMLMGAGGQKLRVDAVSGDWHYVADHTVVAFLVNTFPRRSRQIGLRFDDRWAQVHEPDRAVPNPAPGNYPTWTPEPTPIRRSFDGFNIRLEQLCAETMRYPDSDTRAAVLMLIARERGRPADGTVSVETVRVADPTGNSWRADAGTISDTAGRIKVELGNSLLPDEAAYRVEVDMARTGRYPQEDLWTIPDLQVPPRGKVVRLSRVGRVHGCTLELTHLIGENADSGLPWASGSATAAVRISGPANRFCLRRPAASGRGRDESAVFESGGYYCVTLGSARARGPMDLTLALTPRHTIEFLAHATVDAGREAHR